MTAQDDSDWLNPPTDTTPDDVAPPMYAGVWVCDDENCPPRKVESLGKATEADPASPWAQIYGNGDLLAEATEENTEWALTRAGNQRLFREYHDVVTKFDLAASEAQYQNEIDEEVA